MRTQRVRCYAENLESLSEKGIFLIVAIRKNNDEFFFSQKVECKLWLEIFLIHETDITLKFISWAQSGILIMIFCIFHYHVELTSCPLFNHIDTSALTIASSCKYSCLPVIKHSNNRSFIFKNVLSGIY